MVCMSLLCLTFVYPLFYMVANSLKTRQAYYINKFDIPAFGDMQFSNYYTMITQFDMLNLFKNTGVIVLFSIVFIMIFGILASYAIAKLNFKGRFFLYMIIVSTIFMPVQVTVIPTYSMFARLGLVNNNISVILIYIVSHLPQTIMLLVASFRGIPNELIEAGEIDGCSFLLRIIYIIVPLGKPAIAINVIMNVLGMWNDLFTPMIFLPGLKERTVMVALSSLVQRYAEDPTFQLAGLAMATIPPLVVYICLQKYIVKGIVTGAVK